MTEKFEFIDAEYAAYQESGDEYVPSVVKMCIWMEVSRSGFYEWRDKPESATAKRRGILALYVRKSFEDSGDTYGYRRVHTDLVAWGVPAGPELVRSLMRELGLEACQPRPWRVSLTEGDGQEHDIPDLVNRDFTADAPGEKMVGDITYISTWEGWLFLATVIDCHTKAVIGWAADDNYKTPLIEKAIEMAARNYPLAENAIFHSDRGSNYTSCQFAVTLKKYGLRQSVGRTGSCYDNAMAESFFAALKNERVYRTQRVIQGTGTLCEVYRVRQCGTIKRWPVHERIELPHLIHRTGHQVHHITGFDREEIIDLCIRINSVQPGPGFPELAAMPRSFQIGSGRVDLHAA